MEWGRVAGYEAFALSHPDVAVVGVEDMVAKKRHESSLTSEALRKDHDLYDRAAELITKAIATTGGSQAAALEAQLEQFKESVRAARQSTAQFEEASARSRSRSKSRRYPRRPKASRIASSRWQEP